MGFIEFQRRVHKTEMPTPRSLTVLANNLRFMGELLEGWICNRRFLNKVKVHPLDPPAIDDSTHLEILPESLPSRLGVEDVKKIIDGIGMVLASCSEICTSLGVPMQMVAERILESKEGRIDGGEKHI